VSSITYPSALIAALPETDQALWATAMYAGLRRGELMALRWEDVDLTKNLITVSRSWDVKAGPIEPKAVPDSARHDGDRPSRGPCGTDVAIVARRTRPNPPHALPRSNE
jgi:integrase